MVTPPPQFSQANLIPVVLKLKDVYGIWQSYLPHFSKQARHTLGKRIDDTCLNAIEYSFLASYSQKSEKVILIDRAISRLDLIKILLLLAWESKFLDTKKYTHISSSLEEVGRMLGAWKRQQLQKTPSIQKGEK
jgi:hypothetical protein